MDPKATLESPVTQPAFICSNPTKETLEKSVKYLQS